MRDDIGRVGFRFFRLRTADACGNGAIGSVVDGVFPASGDVSSSEHKNMKIIRS